MIDWDATDEKAAIKLEAHILRFPESAIERSDPIKPKNQARKKKLTPPNPNWKLR